MNQLKFFIKSVILCSTFLGLQAMADDKAAQVDSLFQPWNNGNSPGCAVGVYKNGQRIFEHGYGMADLDNDVPIKPNAVFLVASLSKQFTAAAIVLLAEKNKLSLNDDIRKYFPELSGLNETVTIRHLLHHTSAIRDHMMLFPLEGSYTRYDPVPDDQYMAMIARQKSLNAKPGDEYRYSNTAYVLLGFIVKKVSGLSLREFTTKNIFEPLGMNDTFFADDHREIIKRDARGYDNVNGRYVLGETNSDRVGETGIHTTVRDLQLWNENFYQPKVGGPGFNQQMIEPGKLNDGTTVNYAFGLEHGRYRGLKTVSHLGGDAAFRSGFVWFPEKHSFVAVLCNTSDFPDPTVQFRQIADIFFAEDFPEPTLAVQKDIPAVSVPADKLIPLEGLYRNTVNDSFVEIAYKKGQLFYGSGRLELKSIDSAGKFLLINSPWLDKVEVHFQGNSSYTYTSGTNKPILFQRVTPFPAAPNILEEYVGKFWSPEFTPTYELSIEGTLLKMRWSKNSTVLTPRTRDAFSTTDLGVIQFERDDQQRIKGFAINSARIRNLRFYKFNERSLLCSHSLQTSCSNCANGFKNGGVNGLSWIWELISSQTMDLMRVPDNL